MLGSASTVADGVTMLCEYPRHAVNAYLVEHPDGDGVTLVDAGTRLWGRRLLRRVERATDDADAGLARHVLTHAHPDHQGTTARVCDRFDVPLWCGAGDRAAVESGDLPPAGKSAVEGIIQGVMAGPACDVDGTLAEGDEVAGFAVVPTPGHTPGHVSLWRERDGLLIAGDALLNMDLRTTRVGLHEPVQRFTSDPERARDSIERLVDLEPDTVLFGHGPVLDDDGELAAFVAQLGED